MTPNEFKEQMISNLRTFYPKCANETHHYEIKRLFAEKIVRRLQTRELMDHCDFHLALWVAFPHDNNYIRHMPMREKLAS